MQERFSIIASGYGLSSVRQGRRRGGHRLGRVNRRAGVELGQDGVGQIIVAAGVGDRHGAVDGFRCRVKNQRVTGRFGLGGDGGLDINQDFFTHPLALLAQRGLRLPFVLINGGFVGLQFLQFVGGGLFAALAADERDRRKQAATDKLKELQASKAAIDQYERQAQTTLGEQRQRMREKILVDIKAAVTTKAKAAGCTLVFDTAAETVNGTMAIAYTSGDNDLTDAILSQLNAGAPIDTTKPVTTTPPTQTNSSSNP